MATLNTLRTRGGIIVSVVIGIALLSFLLGDFGNTGAKLMNDRKMKVGTINGEKIGYAEFADKVDVYTKALETMYGSQSLSAEQQENVKNQVWQALVMQYAWEPGFEQSGLQVSENEQIRGVIELQDIIKTGIRERFERLRKMGVKTVMVTGDNPLTAKYIAEQAGVDDFIAEAKPEDKMEYIKREQQAGKLVAMMGDGTNDAPALAQADVGVAMNSGTQAAKEAGNMVDLDNDPTKLIEIVEIGKQLLMTRGTLTTFSIANDVAKYFAIVPALFIASIPSLQALNIMRLHSPESAILSAVIFNAVIIPLLIPLALRGVTYKPIGASALLRRNLFIYGLGGIVAPFIGIKLIDMLISVFF